MSSMNVVLLKTDDGIFLKGAIQASNGSWFDAQGCFEYCNGEQNETVNDHAKRMKARKLKSVSTLVSYSMNGDKDWYLDRANFVDYKIESDSDVDQKYDYNNSSLVNDIKDYKTDGTYSYYKKKDEEETC